MSSSDENYENYDLFKTMLSQVVQRHAPPAIPTETKTKTAPNAPEPGLDLYIAMSNRKNCPEHWALLLCEQGAPRGKRFHIVVSRGPDLNKYKYPPSVMIPTVHMNKRIDSQYMPITEKLATISADDELKVWNAHRKVKPRHCQQYVVALLEELERGGLVGKGTAERFRARVQVCVFEGPVRRIGEGEWVRLEEELGYTAAIEKVHRIQGWLKGYTGSGVWNLD
ncbi:uncharacterized protein DSM5745_03574 [Aspergillus mulundensis]|uniref:Uncharacterized protein n=1 Tax=Aspergillus mulundensis TaxID=1810919 RepID=A0A3D8SKZ8_9EURO|nr:hypothetical protein DSM5745_03574 [Aspergillus mulundensis]RDW86932.1 hypothetical protein DSM5745_03574 [Aspergillus mulundensis]